MSEIENDSDSDSGDISQMLDSYMRDINSMFDLQLRDLEYTISATSMNTPDKQIIMNKLYRLADTIRNNVECPICGRANLADDSTTSA